MRETAATAVRYFVRRERVCALNETESVWRGEPVLGIHTALVTFARRAHSTAAIRHLLLISLPRTIFSQRAKCDNGLGEFLY